MSILWSAGALAREEPAAEKSSSRSRAASKALARTFAILVEMLQEIFDESAYQRFLNRNELQSSSQAYAMFLQENERAKSRRPRCC